jgi:phosphate-selective porin OprO and OprP
MKKTTTTITAKQIAIAVTAVCASLSLPAAANDTKAMLDLMLKKGVITQKDYEEFMEANKDADENKAFKDSRIDKDVSTSIKFIQKRANDGAVKPSSFGLVSGDGKSEINLTGRMHFDYRNFGGGFATGLGNDGNTSGFGDQFDLRRARIGVNGKFLNDFNYEMVWNAAASDSSNVDTAWLNYGANKAAQVRVGRFKQPFNLEDYATSSNNIDFIERSYVNQFNPGKKLGAMIHGVPMDGTAYGVSVFQETNSVVNAAGNRQFAARLATDLIKLTSLKDQVLHFGLAGTSGTYDVTSSSNTASLTSIRTEPRGVVGYSGSFDTSSNTGTSGDLNFTHEVQKKMLGLEYAYLNGPLKLQGEIAEVTLTGIDKGSNTAAVDKTRARGTVKVSYISAVYNLTGENWVESYRDGAFSSVKIKQNFDPAGSGLGAWQVGVRYSTYDASDLASVGASGANGCTLACYNLTADQYSSKGQTVTLGLTWFINPNSRIMLNHAVTSFGTPFKAPNVNTTAKYDSENVTTLRAQYNF